MSTTFPSSKQTFTAAIATNNLDTPSHSEYHNNSADTIEAIEEALGIGSVVKFGLRPASDSTTAIRMQNAAGSVSVVTIDTTNNKAIFLNAGLTVLDTNASHSLTLKPGSDLTADRVLTFTTGDGDRTLTINASMTLDDWFDQSVKTTASPAFVGITLNNTGLHLLDTNASHDLIIKPGSDLTADRTLTLTTGDSDRTLTINGNVTLNDWFDQSVKTTASPTFVDATITNQLGVKTTVALIADLTIQSTSGESLYIYRYSNDVGPPSVKTWKARGTVGTPTKLSDGDDTGKLEFWGYARNSGDTADAFVRTGYIMSEVDGIDAQSRIGGKLVSYTSSGISIAPTVKFIVGKDYVEVYRISTATAVSQYASWDLRQRCSVWDTTNTQAEDRIMYWTLNAGSGAHGSEPYSLSLYDNDGTEMMKIDPMNAVAPAVLFPDYISHLGDPNTAFYLREDRVTVYCGGKVLIDAIETAQDILYLGHDGSNDIDVSIGVSGCLFVEGETGNVTLSNTLIVDDINIPEDSGADVNILDMSVSATPAGGTEESYVFSIDGTAIIEVYAEADGAGGIQNPRFYIHEELNVEGDAYIGLLEFAADAGATTAFDMSVTATPAASTEESYVFKIDATAIMKVYAEADGAGGIQNEAVYIHKLLIVEDIATFTNTGLHILDTNASHDLILSPGSDLTADRTLTFTTGDAARTLTLNGNTTLDDWFDQSVKQAASPIFAGVTLNNVGLHLLDTNASHDLIIAPGSDLTADRTLTITTGDGDRVLTLSANLNVEATSNINQDLTTDADAQLASLTLNNTGLHILDTNATHDLIIAPGSDLSTDRTLTLVTGDADRTLTISGNATLDDWFDQSVKQAANPTFAGVTLNNTGLHLLDTNASHDLILAPGSDLSADRTLTFTTGDASRMLTMSGDATLGDWFDQSVKQAASPTFAGVTLGNTGLHILDTNASHDLIIAPGSDLTADRSLTLITGDVNRTLTLSGDATLSDWFDQSVKQAASPTFAGLDLNNGNVTSLGSMAFNEDAGAKTAFDMSVSASPAAGTEESYAFKIDATDVLKVYAEADNAGSIQNKRVYFSGRLKFTENGEQEGFFWEGALADDASQDLPDAVAGFVHVTFDEGAEWAICNITDAGVVSMPLQSSVNVDNADTDGKYCVFDNGTTVRVRNRIGSEKNVKIVAFVG